MKWLREDVSWDEFELHSQDGRGVLVANSRELVRNEGGLPPLTHVTVRGVRVT